MDTVQINAILRLRRDNDYNFEKIKDTFIPAKGEPVLVDTARNGLRAKVGDGASTYAELPFTDENLAANILVHGYFYEGQFYSDRAYSYLITPSVNKIYIDDSNNGLYVYAAGAYTLITPIIATATETVAGILKLYDTVGQNTDGTMTQKAITDELSDKVEITLDVINETLNFVNDNIN